MSKWRPSPENIYVIPDIHGRAKSLKLILARILPLKKGSKIIFLGDYIDRGSASKEVLDILIDLKSQYGDDVVTLMGNHEWLLLSALGKRKTKTKEDPYSLWLLNGGDGCLFSYGIIRVPKKNQLEEVFPKAHIEFMENLLPYYKLENYVFVHGGADPDLIDEMDIEDIIWDRSIYTVAIELADRGMTFNWDKILVTGHNSGGPFISPKFMMLDGYNSGGLFVFELNSMDAYFADIDNLKLVPVDVKLATERIL